MLFDNEINVFSSFLEEGKPDFEKIGMRWLKIIGFSQPLGYLWAPTGHRPKVSEVVRFQISGISFWSTEALMIYDYTSHRYSL